MKIGVVGYGSIGKRHAANLQALGYKPVIYDPLRRDVKFERDVYETCDAVVIATPTKVHWGCIRAAAERGCHMLIEKPMANGDIDGLRASLALATSKYAAVMMANNFRFHPCIQLARDCMGKGGIGKPRWAQFTSGARCVKPDYLSDGVLLITGGHEVDFALHLLGPAKVSSASLRIGATSPVEDIADFVLQHDNGCMSSFHLDFVTDREIREFRIIGSEGDMHCDLLKRSLTVTAEDTQLPGVFHTSPSFFFGSYDDDYVAEIKAFISRIEGGVWPGATGEDGIATLKILLDVQKMAGLIP